MPLWKFAGPDSYEKVDLPTHMDSSSLYLTVDRFLRMEGGQLHFEIFGYMGFSSCKVGVPAAKNKKLEGPTIQVAMNRRFFYSAEVIAAIGSLSNLDATLTAYADFSGKPMIVIKEDVEDYAPRLYLSALPAKYFVKTSTNKISEDSVVISLSGGEQGITVDSNVSSVEGVYKVVDGLVDYSTNYFDELDGRVIKTTGLTEDDEVIVIYETNLSGRTAIPSGNIFTRISVVSGEIV